VYIVRFIIALYLSIQL